MYLRSRKEFRKVVFFSVFHRKNFWNFTASEILEGSEIYSTVARKNLKESGKTKVLEIHEYSQKVFVCGRESVLNRFTNLCHPPKSSIRDSGLCQFCWWPYNQILFIFHKKSTFQRFSGETTKAIWKIKISKTLFRKYGLKCRCGGSRPKFLVCPSFFIESLSKKNFRGRGPQKSTILGLFSKIDVRNFCQLGKNVFFEISFFLKNRGNGGVILGGVP